MGWSDTGKGFNFRETAGYVTDAAHETVVNTSKGYPTTETIDGDSVTFGWNRTDQLSDFNRSSSADRRLAGENFKSNSDGLDHYFDVDLPASGDYEIHLAVGRQFFDFNGYARVYDGVGGSLLLTVGSPTVTESGDTFIDATDVVRSEANWPGNEVGTVLTFSGTKLRLELGDGASGSDVAPIAHLLVIQQESGTTENITATLAGSSQDSVGSIVLNLTGTTTLAGSSTTGGAITTDNLVAMTATLAGTSQDTAAAGLREAITATLAGTSADGGAISTGDLVMLAATLAGTSEDSGSVRAKVLLAATLAGTSEDSAEAYFGPLVPGTYTTYEAVGIREDLQGKGRERSMSRRALETAEQQLNELLNNR